tara:strand:- start:107 stop:376 length:270 start_codon:yes stop_codon:yes gene_type:complete
MSNKKVSYFNPGGQVDTSKVKKSVLPEAKVNSMFNPTFQPKMSKNKIITYTQQSSDQQKTTRYLEKGKPVKPNTGSLDRINRLKAQAMK